MRPAGGGDSIRLTTDGEKHYAYGYNEPRPNQQRQGPEPRTPTLAWSPDSRYIAVARRDERDVEHMHYISYTSQRPRHFSQPYALPGDSVIPLPTVHIVELEEGEDGDGAGRGSAPALRAAANHRVEVAPTPHQLSFAGSAPDSAWSADGTRLHVNYFTRGSQRVFLAEIDAATGTSRVILGDSTRTFVSLGHRGGGSSGGTPSWYVSEGGDDVIWWSERDGWAHLYRFDGQGNLRNRITSGPWTVGQAVFIDEARQRIYFTARGREPGRNPYYAHLYRVGFDGSGLTLLTPEDANHVIEFSPGGSYFVDTYSRVEGEPVTVLRTAADGGVVRELERADISAIEEIGFVPGEVFTAKARDGITDLYGILYLPPDLDENAKYPIISHIYPGPQRGSVGDWEFKGGGENFALAQLGFVVVQIDHLGTPHRSKAFHDKYYGDFIDNGLPDHIAVIKQLAARRYPFIDLDRVGIYGHSGGGFASTDAILRFPEFFKVAVSGRRQPRQPQLQHLLGREVPGGHGVRFNAAGTTSSHRGQQELRREPRGQAAAHARRHGRQRPPRHDHPAGRRADQGQSRLRFHLGAEPGARPERALLHTAALGLLRAPPAGGRAPAAVRNREAGGVASPRGAGRFFTQASGAFSGVPESDPRIPVRYRSRDPSLS